MEQFIEEIFVSERPLNFNLDFLDAEEMGEGRIEEFDYDYDPEYDTPERNILVDALSRAQKQHHPASFEAAVECSRKSPVSLYTRFFEDEMVDFGVENFEEGPLMKIKELY